MNTYTWPANVLQTDVGVALSFPEWPDLAATGRSVQEAMLAAQESLSTAVAGRIDNNLDILAPSDLGPGQVPIVIRDDVAASLDGYLGERERERMRVRAETEQIHRERRTAFLAEYDAATAQANLNAGRADAGAIKYGVLGIQFAYVLNAGGLVAIPAILQILGAGSETVSDVVSPAVIFVVGIAAAVVANIAAYKSLFAAGAGWAHHSAARAGEVNAAHYPNEDETERRAEIAQHDIDYKTHVESAGRLADIGLAACITSAISFLIGVGLTIFNLAT